MANQYILNRFASGMHFIMLDSHTVTSLTRDGNKRAVCKLNDQLEIHCAIMSKKEGGHFIIIGSSICKKLNIKEGFKLTAAFSIDSSEYQFEMPEELQEVLNTDIEADEIFQSLTKGNQRGLIYLVSQVKNVDKKIERALKIVENLKNGISSPRLILK